MKQLKKISIITPTLNSEKDIESCILSVAEQSYKNIEHLIIDGLSTDATLEIVEKYAQQYPHVKFISEKDSGIYDAMNKGIDMASGDWLYFLGSDDVFYGKEVLEKVFIKNNYSDLFDFLYGDVIWGDTQKIYDGKFSPLKLTERNICHQAIFFKKELFIQYGKFNVNYKAAADWAFNIKIFNLDDVRKKYINTIIAKYQINGFSSLHFDNLFMSNKLDLIKNSFPEEYKCIIDITTKDKNFKFAEENFERSDIKVTIVVPIYKDVDSLIRCIISLKNYVDNRHKILLINDRSQDYKEVEFEILNLIKGDSRFEYHLNSVNLGFVKTCNKAVYDIDKTGNDILLLNSDTVVTEGFLEEMISILCLNEKHGVVCPRSNNASILTVPYNYLGNRMDMVEESYVCYQKIKTLLPKYSIIPTAVGFCMLIRRHLIDNYGLFDEIYSPGYNEENDFSMRINRYGYSLIMSNYSYVFHCESKSFSSDQKKELNKTNLQKLVNRYPYYFDVVSKYLNYQINPVEYFAEFIDPYFFKKKSILFSLLDLQPVYNGTAEYALNLLKYFVDNFSDKYEIDILTNPSANEYHKISKTYSNVFFESNIKKHYHLAILPSQFFDISHLLLLNRLSLKIVFSLLDIIALRCNYLSSQSPFLENLSAMALTFADGIVSISEYTKKDTLSYFSEKVLGDFKDKIRVIHLGLDDKEAHLGINKEIIPFKKYILIVGNQHFDHKSIKEVVDQLIKTDIKFCVVGCKEYIQNDKYVGYPSGNLTNEHMDSLFRNSELVVFPSTYEGFGLPILKALKFKKKVILLDSEVNREIANTYNNKNFVFYKKNNEIEFAIKLGLTKDFVNIEKIKTWKDVAIETEKFIDEVLNEEVNPVELQKRWFSLTAIEQKIKDTKLKDVMISELRDQLHSTFREYGLVKSRKLYKFLDRLSKNNFVRGAYKIIKNNKKYIWRK